MRGCSVSSHVVGEIGRGYIQQDLIEVRFDSKYNGKALKCLRIFQTLFRL